MSEEATTASATTAVAVDICLGTVRKNDRSDPEVVAVEAADPATTAGSPATCPATARIRDRNEDRVEVVAVVVIGNNNVLILISFQQTTEEDCLVWFVISIPVWVGQVARLLPRKMTWLIDTW